MRRTRHQTLAVALLLVVASASSAAVTLLDYPQELVSLDDRATVTWEEDVRCFIAYGPAPGVYTSRTVTEAVRELTFVPADEAMQPGMHFCVVRAVGTEGDSEEFQIIVESPVFPEPRTPPNGTSVDETTTLLEWDPVDRVPYYHVVVSDSEIEISEVEGEIVLTGANIIWQAITSGTTIQYGAPDPSGYFIATNGTSPPLMSGFTYNWLVLNNYGNHPLLTSIAGAGLAGFTAEVPADVEAPTLVTPQDSVSVAEEVLRFDWSDVPEARGYHLYIHEKRDWAGGEAGYPVWDGATTESEAEVSVGSFLPRGEYCWRVVALDVAGRGACSPSRYLHYETETGQARIVTENESGDPLPWVFVEIEFAHGGVEAMPVITNENGIYNKDLIPGEYVFNATKAGHVDTLEQATVWVDDVTTVRMELRRAPARIRGTVEDEDGDPVFDALVRATRGEDGVSSGSDADGNFVLTVTPGEWTMVARKQGYEASAPLSATVAAGDYYDVPSPLRLLGTPGTVSGTIVNTSGNPLPAATVRAENGIEGEGTVTNGSGAFTLELAPGRWAVHAVKSGYQESDEREIEIPAGGNVSLDPPVALSPVAASVSGRVTDGSNAIAGARVVAVPRSGPVVTTTTNGYGEFVLLPDPASYVVRAFASGYAPSEERHVSVSAQEAFPGIELEVAPLECLVLGRVTDGNEPVPSAVVGNGVCETQSGPDGTFELALPRGVHDLVAGKSGYFSGAPTRVAAAPGRTLAGLSLRVADGACSISGTTLCDDAGVACARVTAVSGGARVESLTGDDGGFELPVEAGTWTLHAHKDGFGTSEPETIIVAAGQSAAGVDLGMEDESAVIRGVVADAQGPVRGADVLVVIPGEPQAAYRTVAGSAGGYRIRVAAAGGYRVSAGAPGRGTDVTEIGETSPGEEKVANFTLPRYDGVIQGLVTGHGEPVPGASVTATWGDSASAVSDRRGRFTLWVDEGLYDVRVERPGYESLVLTDVEVVAGWPAELVVELSGVFATLAGAVSDSASGEPVEGALLTATWPDGGSSWVTGSDGAYELPDIVPGEALLRCSAPGYRSLAETVVLEESEHASLVIDLLELTGTIAGTVSTDTRVGLSGACVRAKLGDDVLSTATTGADGHYVLTGLDPFPFYDVHASLGGYYAASDNPVTGVTTQSLGIDFTLLPCTGAVAGRVTDAVSGEPLAGATVTADDGDGHFGEDRTDEEGRFSVAGLVPTTTYTVTASLFGYHDALVYDVSPEESDLELTLPRNFARILGTVSAGSSEVSLDEIEVVATSTSYGGVSRVAAPSPSGAYEVTELRPGSYVASVSAPGCLSTPAQIPVSVGEGETLAGLDFAVDAASIERVEVGGPTTVEAGGSAVFTADAIASGNRIVEADLSWWVSPAAAGVIGRSSGELSCSPNYIGEATVAAIDAASGEIGRLSLTVYALIDATTDAAFADSSGMVLEIEPGAVQSSKSVYLSHERVPDSKRYRERFEVSPLSYSLKPSGLVFEEDELPYLALPAASAATDMVLWNEDELLWSNAHAEHVPGAVEAEIGRLGEYATSTDSRPLGVGDLRAEPNPFSPRDGAVVISYDLTSSGARMPFVTVRIFNMASQLVRTVAENEPQGKGRASLEWDGLTDDGEAARNGRYVVEIRAEDSSGTETALTTLVLVK